MPISINTSASPRTKSQFAELKSAAKQYKEEARTWKRLEPTLKELGYDLPEEPAARSTVLDKFGVRPDLGMTASRLT